MNAHQAADPVIVVGGGVAGLAVALELSPRPVILIAPKAETQRPATAMAQGGIAAAIGADDAPALHAQDTLAAAAGLGNEEVAVQVTAAAPGVIARLVAWGVPFDRDSLGNLALGLEAAHCRLRITHANGDATGKAVHDTLKALALRTPSITVRHDLSAIDLLMRHGAARGVVCRDPAGRRVVLKGRAVVLATGGIGALYASTTNPEGALGQGLAIAARAGAVLRDMEFVQFHPTAIAVGRAPGEKAPLPLATEALRGAGAILVNDRGERFMAGVPGRELAPRDVVARAIHAEILAGRRVFLDARAKPGPDMGRAFPSVSALCRQVGIDPAVEPIPVRPAAHYHMGGVKVDAHGRTSLPGLWACGEVASTGLHGANRLASNSLLEALVYAHAISEDLGGTPAPAPLDGGEGACGIHLADGHAVDGLHGLMDEQVGVVRDSAGLSDAVARLAPLARCASAGFAGAGADAALVAFLVSLAALRRRESRGGHFRLDHPAPVETLRQHGEMTLKDAFAAYDALEGLPVVTSARSVLKEAV